MENFDYNQFFTFTFPLKKMKYVYELIKPNKYDRLYQQIRVIEEKKKSEDKNNKGKNNINSEIHKESEELKDALIKNQLALGLIYQSVREARYDREENICIVTLNSILTYELYVTISHRMLKLTNYIKNTKKKLEKASDIEKVELETKLTNYKFEYVDLKSLIDIVVEQLAVESIYAIQLDYHKMSLISHMEKSLIRQD